VSGELKAYCVSIVLDGNRPFTNLLVAPSAEAAAAISGVVAGRTMPDGEVASVVVMEIGEDWLRRSLRMIEGKQPAVVSLVSDNLRPPETPGAA
jgi:hypothetical protein